MHEDFSGIAELLDADNAKATLPPIEVKAGEAASIAVDQPDITVSAAGADEVTVNVVVRDQHGNPVEADTGVSFFVNDSLHVVESTGATNENGQASVTIRGGDIAEASGIKINAGAVSQTIPVSVKPLTIEFIDVDNTLFAGASDDFTVRITDYQGQPVPDLEVKLGSNYGFLSETQVTTDTNGEATASLTVPDSDGNGQLTAQVGRSAWHKKAFDVVYPQSQNRDLEVDNAMMVGDTDTEGVIDHTRYDATRVNVPYKVSRTIRALGNEGDAVTVTIGDFRDPNRAPIAAYYMNTVFSDQVADDTGHYSLHAQHVTQASGTPMGGGRSLRFSPANVTPAGAQPSILWTDSAPLLKKSRSLGFSIDLKPAAGGGMIVDLGSGGQQLRLNSAGELVYTVRTADNTYQLTSAALTTGQWHRVAARYHDGEVTLWVDGEQRSKPATGGR